MFLKGPGTQWVLSKRQASVPVLEITLDLLTGHSSAVRREEDGWREYYAPEGAVRERRCHDNHILALFSM